MAKFKSREEALAQLERQIDATRHRVLELERTMAVRAALSGDIASVRIVLRSARHLLGMYEWRRQRLLSGSASRMRCEPSCKKPARARSSPLLPEVALSRRPHPLAKVAGSEVAGDRDTVTSDDEILDPTR